MRKANSAPIKTLLAICLLLAQPGLAAKPTTRRFEVTPTSIRSQLFDQNISVLIGMNSVYRAKEEVSLARANLLPSVDLTTMLGAGAFSLQSVSVLLPFLFPSNWGNLKASERQLAAGGIAYYLVKLNQYASAYSLYQTILGDIALLEVYRRQTRNYDELEAIVRDRAFLGTATETEVEQASSQAQMARVQLAQIEALIAQEKASMRKVLGLSLRTDIRFVETHPEAFRQERRSATSLLDEVYARSPENRQVDSLIEAGRARKFSAAFAWLGGASLNTKGPGISSPTVTGRTNLGFGIFPTVKLSELDIEEMRLRKREIKLEQARILESTLNSLDAAEAQLNYARLAETNLRSAYEAQLEAYTTGTVNLQFLLETGDRVTRASIARIGAQTDLDNHRVNLGRVLIEGPFRRITDCKLTPQRQGPIGWMKGIFGKASTSIDELCN